MEKFHNMMEEDVEDEVDEEDEEAEDVEEEEESGLEESEEESEESDDGDDAFDSMRNAALEEIIEPYRNLVKKHLNRDESQKRAMRKAAEGILPEYRKLLIEKYRKFLMQAERFKHNPIHIKIKASIKNLMSNADYDWDEAVKYALKKRKYIFDPLLALDSGDEEDEGGSRQDEEDDEGEDEDDEAGESETDEGS
jgi:hypothetical protein